MADGANATINLNSEREREREREIGIGRSFSFFFFEIRTSEMHGIYDLWGDSYITAAANYIVSSPVLARAGWSDHPSLLITEEEGGRIERVRVDEILNNNKSIFRRRERDNQPTSHNRAPSPSAFLYKCNSKMLMSITLIAVRDCRSLIGHCQCIPTLRIATTTSPPIQNNNNNSHTDSRDFVCCFQKLWEREREIGYFTATKEVCVREVSV
jgi:hypothetical protein